MSETTETFFRPPESSREQLTIPAPLYNRCRLLLNRCPNRNVLVPIRSMQCLAVIDPDEINFVDNLGYAVQDGKGGRLIIMTWITGMHADRDSLNEPIPIEIVYYDTDAHDTLRRLMSEFPAALERHGERQKATSAQRPNARVLPFTKTGV